MIRFHPMRFLMACLVACVRAAYNETIAVKYANLAGAAYCSPESVKNQSCGAKCDANDVSNIQVCHGQTSYSFVGLWDTTKCLISFEGTWDPWAWLQDLDVKEITSPWPLLKGKVHAGFVEEWFSHQGCILEALEKIGCGKGSKLHTTGHSLGAALSALANVALEERGWIVAESYDFGRPRLGDATFASFLEVMFRGRVWRVVHHRDPVPHGPVTDYLKIWHFKHTAPEVFYHSPDFEDGYSICVKPDTDPDDTNCSFQYEGEDYLANVFYWHDHMSYMNGVPMYGQLPLWARVALQLPESGCVGNMSSSAKSVSAAVLLV